MKNNFFKNFLILIFSFFLLFKIFEEIKKDNFLEFFYVGQGDGILINTGKTQIIIDGGPDNTILHKLGNTLPYFDKKIEFLILTHPDADHLTGLIEILERYEVENIVLNGMKSKKIEWIEFTKNFKDSKIFFSNEISSIDLEKNYSLKIFFPKEKIPENTSNLKSNYYSIISGLYKKDEPIAIFTGDAEILSQQKVPNETFKILKVSHHGSKKNTNSKILEKFSPEIGIISAGKKNSYGHPHPEILKILKEKDVEIVELKNGDFIFQL